MQRVTRHALKSSVEIPTGYPQEPNTFHDDLVVHRRPTPALCGHVGVGMNTSEQRDFGPFIPECAKRGLGKTKSYQLANAGMLEVFKIGAKTYVYMDSLLSLPKRLAQADGLTGIAA